MCGGHLSGMFIPSTGSIEPRHEFDDLNRWHHANSLSQIRKTCTNLRFCCATSIISNTSKLSHHHSFTPKNDQNKRRYHEWYGTKAIMFRNLTQRNKTKMYSKYPVCIWLVESSSEVLFIFGATQGRTCCNAATRITEGTRWIRRSGGAKERSTY